MGKLRFKRLGEEKSKPAPPVVNFCEHPSCNRFGHFGYGPPGYEGMRQPSTYYCREHRPENRG